MTRRLKRTRVNTFILEEWIRGEWGTGPQATTVPIDISIEDVKLDYRRGWIEFLVSSETFPELQKEEEPPLADFMYSIITIGEMYPNELPEDQWRDVK